MDARHFDALSRQLASIRPRRDALRWLFAGLVGAIAEVLSTPSARGQDPPHPGCRKVRCPEGSRPCNALPCCGAICTGDFVPSGFGGCSCGCPPRSQQVGANRCQCQNPDEEICDGRCVNTESNDNHCGRCGNRCADVATDAFCFDGLCSSPGCQPGFVRCHDGRRGDRCIDPLRSRRHCGGCNRRCKLGQICCSGQCRDISEDNCGECGKTCADGEICCSRPLGGCVDLRTDPANCGKCGTFCGQDGVCQFGQCIAGTPCPPNHRPCGNHCCPRGHDCSPDLRLCSPRPQARDCPPNHAPCGSVCCPPGLFCSPLIPGSCTPFIQG